MDGALRAYLMVIELQPKAVETALKKVMTVRTGASISESFNSMKVGWPW
jgi:hypothetical protein